MDTTSDSPTSPSALPLSGQLIINDPNDFAHVKSQSGIIDSLSTPQMLAKSR